MLLDCTLEVGARKRLQIRLSTLLRTRQTDSGAFTITLLTGRSPRLCFNTGRSGHPCRGASLALAPSTWEL